MDSIFLKEEVIQNYEEILKNTSKNDLLILPHQLKNEGNKLMKTGDFENAIQYYIKALMAFDFLLNHDYMNTTEQIVETIQTLEVFYS